jgi:ribonuclease P protein component
MKTIKKRSEFLHVSNVGYCVRMPTFILLGIKSDELVFGFTASKRVGKAHKRNFAKRRMREVSRFLEVQYPDQFVKCVFIAKASLLNVRFDDFKRDALKAFSILIQKL